MIAVGDLVIVDIKLDKVTNAPPDVWNRLAAQSMNGKTGVVEQAKPSLGYLVRFHVPAKKWWSSQSSVEAFWFTASELLTVPQIRSLPF